MMNLNDMTFDAVLTEAQDYFAAQGVRIMGEGYKEIAGNRALFESYVEKLVDGASANSAATITQLMENTNAEILTENSLTGIQPISSLAMPVIRKLWPKFALKDAMKTQVAKTPRFTVAYTKPYMIRGEEKVYLPYGLKDANGDLSSVGKKDYVTAHVTVAVGAAVVVDYYVNTLGEGATSPVTTGDDGYPTTTGYALSAAEVAKTIIANTPSLIKKLPLDELKLLNVKVGATTVHIGKRLDVTGSAVYPVAYTTDGTVDYSKGQIIVKFEGSVGKCTIAYVGGTSGTTLKADLVAGVSTEFNEDAWDVGFDMPRQDIDIPTGQHINANLPIEFLNDAMATYQIDATKEIVDIMTNVCAMRLDLEALDFIQESFINIPSNEAFFNDKNIPHGPAKHMAIFDCVPQPGFAGTPKAWREQLRTSIDYLAQQIKNETYLGAGQFKVVCNPLDAQLISNVNWEFQGASNSVDGVSVDYSVGTFQGANFYSIISSVNVPQGLIYIVFIPETNSQMTYCYFPYSFSTSLGYISPNRSRTPSVMMTKRHTFAEFMPAVAAIEVLNNTGNPYTKYVYASTSPLGVDGYPYNYKNEYDTIDSVEEAEGSGTT